MSGKGSRPRPYSISQDEYAANFDRIFKKTVELVTEQPENVSGTIPIVAETRSIETEVCARNCPDCSCKH